MTVEVVCTPDELTSAWMGEALGRPVDVRSVEAVGTGQIGACYRVSLSGPGGDETVLAKLPAADPGTREMLAGAYRGEVTFYADLAGTVAVVVPRCDFAAMRPGTGEFTLLLEDLAPAVQGDQLAGCSVEQARTAVVNLAGLHGPRWCDPSLTLVPGLTVNGPEDAAVLAELYGPATETFMEGLGDLVSEEDVDTLHGCVEVAEPWALARSERFALVHGDYRLDNLMFGTDDAVWAVDWQTLSLALPARDLAYFVGTSLDVGDRRGAERDLVAAYHAALVGHGVTAYDEEQCWDDYRFAMVQGPLVAVFGYAYGTRTERGDRMFAAMVRRACAAIRDLETLSLARG
ncbi:MAG: phosphotransferase [Marmoricola sp.]